MSYPATCILNNAKLNCQGILNLQERNPKQAILCFSTGLRSVLSIIQQKQQGHYQQSNDDNAPLCRADRLFSVPLPESDKATSSSQQNNVRADNGECRFALYNRPLHLSFAAQQDDDVMTDDNDDDDLMVTETDCDILCAVFLFNIGLAYHMKAMEQGGGNSKLLHKAVEFYSMAHRALPDYNDDASVNVVMCDRSISLAHLALANNLGHIHFFWCHFDETKVCADEMLDWLAYHWSVSSTSSSNGVVKQHGSNNTAASGDEETDQEYQIFMLNAAFYRVTDLMPAAAA